MKTAVIVANGVEEGEVLTIVDIFRRAEVDCTLLGLDHKEIQGAHDIMLVSDQVFDEKIFDYDMVVLPGGYGCAEQMKNHAGLQNVLKQMNADKKWIGAICAAPLALDQAGVLDGKTFTCYPSVKEKIQGGTRTDEAVFVDQNLVTGQGPALAWQFAYKLLDVLGVDSEPVKKRMVYRNAFGEEE